MRYIYKITNPKGKVYIGQTGDFENRMSAYKSGNCKKQTKLYRSLSLFGWDAHNVEIICKCLTQSIANEKELENIVKYNSIIKGLNSGAAGGGRPMEGNEAKKSYNVYLEPSVYTQIIDKHGSLTKAIETTI